MSGSSPLCARVRTPVRMSALSIHQVPGSSAIGFSSPPDVSVYAGCVVHAVVSVWFAAVESLEVDEEFGGAVFGLPWV